MKLGVEEKWDLIDRISRETVTFGAYKHTLKDAIGELTIKPLTGIPIAIAVMYGFWSVFGSFAGFFTDGFFVRLFDAYWLPWLQEVFPGQGSFLYTILVDAGGIESGEFVLSSNCLESFGVLTSGLFVAIGIVLPAIIIFYLMLALLEDIGYMPRLAVLIDTMLHKIGLHGYAIVPTILSLGCNVPGVTATRILETKKQRFIMMTLLAIFIPCGAQIGIMETLVPHLMGWILLYLIIGYFIFGYILNKVIPGKAPEFLIDVPPYRRPMLSNICKKVGGRVKGFFVVAIPFVMLGCAIVGVLYWFGVISVLGDLLAPIFVGWFGVPAETAGPLVAAFLRKDLAVAQLSVIPGMTDYQMITSVVLVSIYFPCVATFAMMLKEGWKELIGALVVLAVTVFAYGGLIHLIGKLLGVA